MDTNTWILKSNETEEEWWLRQLKRKIDAGEDTAFFTERGSTPLALAAHRGYVDACKLLLEVGVPVDNALPGFKTPLIAACESAAYEVVKILVEAGANVNYECGAGRRVIHYAAIGGSVEIGKLLVSAGASLHDKFHSVSVGELSISQVARTFESFEFLSWVESCELNSSTLPIPNKRCKSRL